MPRDAHKTLFSILNWLSTIVGETDAVLVQYSRYTATFQFRFPLRTGDTPYRIRTRKDDNPRFIIRRPAKMILDPSYVRIFALSYIEVFEKKRGNESHLPLRMGLSEKEKTAALQLARDSIEQKLRGQDEPSERNTPERFWFSADVNVAIWVAGSLRGSQIVERQSLGRGIITAAQRAAADPRFEPVTLGEMSRARIEVGVLHLLRVPLSKGDRASGRIFPEKGYTLSANGRRGWFLPEVLNVRRFKNLGDFLVDLAEEKAGLKRDVLSRAGIEVFEVDDFVESCDSKLPISLYGPMPEPQTSESARDQKFRACADWLCAVQEPDGNIPPIVEPLSGRTASVDLVRLAFTSWALAEFAKTVNDGPYLAAAEKSFHFLSRKLLGLTGEKRDFSLALAYFGRLALSLGKTEATDATSVRVRNTFSFERFDPIAHAQVAGFLRSTGSNDESTLRLCGTIERTLKEQFQIRCRKGEPMSLALWAELVNVFKEIDPAFAREVSGWLLVQQLETGAFPESTTSPFVYTRGTGKIFEVLALEKENNGKSIQKVLAWLFSMQYTRESAFFISDELLPNALGAFRHDYLNQGAWIDAAGHILLGASRLVEKRN